MISTFGVGSESATSSHVESEFSMLKSKVLKNERPLRIDKFVMSHIRYLDGRLKLQYPNLKHASETSCLKEESDDSRCFDGNKDEVNICNLSHTDSQCLNEVENWRGKGTDKSVKADKITFLSPLPNWDLFPRKDLKIPFLKIGSLCNSVAIDQKHIIVQETCAFDPLIQITMYSIAIKNYFINYAENFTLQLATALCESGKVNSGHYRKRAEILKNIQIFSLSNYRENMNTLNTNCNVSHLAEYLFPDIQVVQ